MKFTIKTQFLIGKQVEISEEPFNIDEMFDQNNILIKNQKINDFKSESKSDRN